MKNTMKTISIALISLSLFLTSCGKDECQLAVQRADQLEISYNNTKKQIDADYKVTIEQYDALKQMLNSQLTGLKIQASLIKMENYPNGYVGDNQYRADVANANAGIKIIQDEINKISGMKTQAYKDANTKRTAAYNKYNSDLANIRSTCPNNPVTKKYQSQI